MEYKGLKIDFAAIAQILFGLAALATAWKSRQKATKKPSKETKGE